MNNFMLRTLFLSLLLFFIPEYIITGDDDSKKSPIKTIQVDTKKPESWPKPLSQWKAIKRSTFEKLVKISKTSLPEKKKTWIRDIEYSASIINGSIHNGRFQAKIDNHSQNTEFLSLTPMNLSIDNLKWKEEKANFGVSSDGHAILKVNEQNQELSGSWNFPTLKMPGLTILNLQLMPSNISNLKLITSQDKTLTSEQGIVSHTELTNNQTEWLINLGRITETIIRIRNKQPITSENSLVIADVDNFYTAQQNGFNFQSQLNLEIIGNQLDQLKLQVPTDYQISNIQWGNDYPLKWKSNHHNNLNQITIFFPDSIQGKIRPIQIKGSSSLLPGIEHSLHSFTPLNSRIRKNVIHLTVQSPLQLNSLDHHGFRQTDISVLRNNSEVFRFEQNFAKAHLNVNVSQPEFSFHSKILTHLGVSFEKTFARSEIQLLPISGSQFSVSFELEPRWNISSLKSSIDPHSILDWSIKKKDNQTQVLTINFRQFLSSDSPQTILIEVEDISHSDNKSFNFPLINPVNASTVEQAISLIISEHSTPNLIADSSLSIINPEEFPDYVFNSRLWNEISEGSQRFHETTYYYYSENISEKESISTTDPLPYSTASSQVTCQIDQDRIIENYTLSIDSTTETTAPLLIYINHPGPSLDWTCTGQSPISIQAELIPKGNLAEYNVPEDGELWKLSFLSPVKGKIYLKTDRERAFSQESLDLSLATILNSKTFTGNITVFEETFNNYEITTYGNADILSNDKLIPLPENLINSKKEVKSWSFQSPDDKVTLRKRTLDNASSISQLATLELNSDIFESDIKDNLHTVILKFPIMINQTSLEFSLPPAAELVSIFVDETIVRKNRIEEFTWKISDITTKSKHEIKIHYITKPSNSKIVTNHSIPVPSFNGITLDQFVWNISLPESQNIYTFSKGLFLESSPRKLNWTKRLFGPIGRSQLEHFFNPLNFNNWKQLFTYDPLHGKNEHLMDLPKIPNNHNWIIHSATGITLPETIEFQTWNYQNISNFSWLGMGLLFIAGIMVRSKEYPYRRMAGYLWYTIISAIAILAAPWIAFPAGAMLCGSVLAILVPRKYLIHKKEKTVPEDIPMGSTVSFQNISGTMVLLTGLLFPLTLSGQNSNSDSLNQDSFLNTKTAEDNIIQVLIPQNNRSNTNPSIVYLKESDINYLSNSQIPSAPDYLIKSGNYKCHVNKGIIKSVDAVFKIEVLSQNKTIAIEISLDQVSLLGEHPCQLNGKDYPITISEDLKQFKLILNPQEVFHNEDNDSNTETELSHQYKQITLKLSLFPLPSNSGSINDFEMKIPSLASSYFEIEDGEKLSQFVVTDAQNRILSSQLENKVQANISWTDHIRLFKKTNLKLTNKTIKPECTIANNVHIHPSLLKYDYNIYYTNFSSSIKTLNWSFPKDMFINQISGESEFDYKVSHNEKETLVQLNLKSLPENDLKFKVECSFPYELKDNKLQIPAKQIHESTDNPDQIVTNNYYLSITSNPGTIAELVENKSLSFSQVDIRNDDDIQKSYNLNPSSQMIINLNSSTQIPMKLLNQLDSRSAIINYEYTINLNQLQTLYRIALKINDNSLPVFQHHFSVSHQFKISSITVKEDQANRLLRWTRTGNMVTLFLNNKTKGTQNIEISGSIQYETGKNIPLPDITIKNTINETRTVKVFQNPNFHKQVRIATKTNTEINTLVQPEDYNTQKSLLIFEKELQQQDILPNFYVMDSVSQPDVESFTQIDDSAEDSYTITSWLRFFSSDGPIPRINFQVDQHSILSELNLQCANAHIQTSKNKNNTNISLIAKNRNESELILVLKYKLSKTSNPTELMPGYIFNEHQIQKHYIQKYSDNSFELNIPEARTVSSLDSSPLIKNIGTLDPGKNLYQFDKFENVVIRKQDNRLIDHNQVLLSDTRIWITPNQSLQGSMILIFYSTMNDFSLNWPENLDLTSVTVNGLQQSIPDHQNNKVRIPIAPLRTHQTILINWNSSQNSPDSLFHLQNQEFPKPWNIPVKKNLVSLIPSKKLSIIPSKGIEHSNRASHILDWIEEILKTYQVAYNSSSFPRENWRQFVRQVIHLNQQANGGLKNPLLMDLDINSRRKLKSLNQQIQKLNANVQNLNPASTNPSITNPYTPGFEWTIELPANSVFGKFSSSNNTDQIEYWCLSRNMINTFLAIIFCFVSLFFSKQIFRFHIGDKLVDRSGYCWLITGLLFWLCLDFSFIGFCIMIAGIALAVQQELALRKKKNTEATIL